MTDFHDALEAIDDVAVNPGTNPALADVLRADRRQFLKGGMSLTLAALAGSSLSACQLLPGSRPQEQSLLGFASVPAALDKNFDTVQVPPAYSARAFFSWGDAVMPGAPAWRGDAREDAAAQALQAGDNHDGMWFFPFPENPDGHGLLVVNHESINPQLHAANTLDMKKSADGRVLRPVAEVDKEKMAHGLSIIEIRKDAQGEWQRIYPSRYNRRLTAETPMRLAGPVAGTDWVKTADDTEGRQVRGTLNNCAMGVTPWGTYLMCEENWHNYFVNRDKADHGKRVAHWRYGIGNGMASKYYAWESVDARFDATPDAARAHDGFVNEPNRFGWVVEVDPFSPQSLPVKRTALGRFCREGATVTLAKDGRVVVYSGDDTAGEYVYKFVSAKAFRAGDRLHNRDLLDEGTLYAGRFLPGGEGQWCELTVGKGELTPANGFHSQADVLVNARRAADLQQATPLDRPEWVTVDGKRQTVYLTLTNHKARGKEDALDAANPRPENRHGHILRWDEAGADAAATQFHWDIFLLAGEKPGARDVNSKPVPDNLVGNIRGDIFSSPDGLYMDPRGRLWIATDFDDDSPEMAAMGCNQLLCADPASREVRRFLVGPRGAEITGITLSPDGRSLWINVQHPGGSYPASDGHSRPRATTVLIRRDDGGIIGT